MSAALVEVFEEGERRVNRSCAVVARLILIVVAVSITIGFTGLWAIDNVWMYYYFAAVFVPLLAVVVYAKKKDYRGRGIKYLMIFASLLIPASMSVPTIMGFLMMPLPIVVAGRYFSRRIVWCVYLLTLAVTLVMIFPHARFGIPSYPLCSEARNSLQLFLDGRFDRLIYLRYLVLYCFPSFAVCLSYFAFTMSSLCNDHMHMLEHQARVNARLADVEKGLAIAATMQLMGVGVAGKTDDGGALRVGNDASRPQPDVRDWSTKAILDCISRVKRRAASDSDFAALVERDPSAAVREVQS